jgi:hypothetical protein
LLVVLTLKIAFHWIRAVTSWKLRSSHRNWEDWLGIFLGILVVLAPWITEETANSSAVANAAVVGLVVMVLAEADFVNFRRWIGATQLICGPWVAASPLIFRYGSSGSLRIWNLVVALPLRRRKWHEKACAFSQLQKLRQVVASLRCAT